MLSLVSTLIYSRMIKKLLVIAGLINVMQLQTLSLPYVLNPPNPRTYKNDGYIRVVRSRFPNFKIALKFVDKNYTYCWWLRTNFTNFEYTSRKPFLIFKKFQYCSGLRNFNNQTINVACSLSVEKIGEKSLQYIETTLTEVMTSSIRSMGKYEIYCTVENASSKYPPPDNNNTEISQACRVLFSDCNLNRPFSTSAEKYIEPRALYGKTAEVKCLDNATRTYENATPHVAVIVTLHLSRILWGAICSPLITHVLGQHL